MKHPLTKTELTGLILLGVLVVAITGIAFLAKDCGGSDGASIQEQGPRAVISVADTTAMPAKTETVPAKPRKAKQAKKNAKKRAAPAVKAKAEKKDPFSDTIPRY